jgi:CheY-like chemotaxis protein
MISVTDAGEGMDEATLARCVEPFFTTKGIGKGTGLGLSMVYGLAEQSGGRLVMRSREGEGTTAELWLPRAEAPIEATPVSTSGLGTGKEAAKLPREGCARRTVLVVDDDPLVLAATVSMLEDVGHRVLEATSGRRALEILPVHQDVDMVLTDQVMPQMTGLQLAAELRRLWPELPVLLGSGYTERAELLVSGLPLLSKPFMQGELMAAIEACLAVKGTPRGTAGPSGAVEERVHRRGKASERCSRLPIR